MVDGGSDSANHEGQYAPLIPEDGKVDWGSRVGGRVAQFAADMSKENERTIERREVIKAIVV